MKLANCLFLVLFAIHLDFCVSERRQNKEQSAQNPNGIMEHNGPKPTDPMQQFMSDIMNNKISVTDVISGKVPLPAEIQEFGKEIGVHVISILLANVAVSMLVPPPQPEPFFG